MNEFGEQKERILCKQKWIFHVKCSPKYTNDVAFQSFVIINNARICRGTKHFRLIEMCLAGDLTSLYISIFHFNWRQSRVFCVIPWRI